MQNKLHYNTITPLLLSILRSCMLAKEFDSFRLVGGTALSLQLGHRRSFYLHRCPCELVARTIKPIYWNKIKLLF